MKCTIPEISWHNREPVLSVDIHPQSNECYKLASGGGDSHILIWQMVVSENGAVKQEVISDLTRHQRAVNCVRWSPSGQYLASADDDANIIIWQLKNDNIPLLEGDSGDKEIWIVHKILRGHKEDIYDLCWSLDSTKLFSGSVDNTAILWDLKKGKLEHILSDHKGFVQGVTWDPKNQLLASISTDRMCRLFDITGKQVKARIHKGKLPLLENHFLHDKEVKYFHDDTFKSFFRRLQFSPDGSLLIVPSGHIQVDDCKKVFNATLVFTLDDWTQPSVVLPIPKQCSTVVRFCPILFKLHEEGPKPIVKLPYRMIFAIGTDHDVILYDTQQSVPFARFHEIHYTRLTDITWSNDGLLLTASSTDGFCALITFEPKELGEIYTKGECQVEQNTSVEPIIHKDVDKDENVDTNNQTDSVIKKKSSFIEKWALNTSNKVEKSASGKRVQETIEIMDDQEENILSKEVKDEINKLIPRRSAFKKTESATPGAKWIEIRRTPRDSGESSNNNKCIAKHIEVKQKPEKEMEITVYKIDKCLNSNDKHEVEVQKDHNCTENKWKNTSILNATPKNTDHETKSMIKRKKDETPKSKSARKKLCTTPPKSTTLLNFFKGRGANIIDKVDLTVEEEARDAWVEGRPRVGGELEEESLGVVPMEEDCTEDFCLQLEDTQETTREDTIDDKEEAESDTIEQTEKSISSFQTTKDSSKEHFKTEVIKSKGKTNIEADIILVDDDNEAKLTKVEDRKMPRRVPLITLASPKANKNAKS